MEFPVLIKVRSPASKACIFFRQALGLLQREGDMAAFVADQRL